MSSNEINSYFNPTLDINDYLQYGHDAMKKGNIQDSVKWYYEALSKAKELKDQFKEKEVKKYLIALL